MIRSFKKALKMKESFVLWQGFFFFSFFFSYLFFFFFFWRGGGGGGEGVFPKISLDGKQWMICKKSKENSCYEEHRVSFKMGTLNFGIAASIVTEEELYSVRI